MNLRNLCSVSRDHISHFLHLHLHKIFPELEAGLTGEYALVCPILHSFAAPCASSNEGHPSPAVATSRMRTANCPALCRICTLQCHQAAPWLRVSLPCSSSLTAIYHAVQNAQTVLTPLTAQLLLRAYLDQSLIHIHLSNYSDTLLGLT